MAAFGLHAGSDIAAVAAVISQVHTEMTAQAARIIQLETKIEDMNKDKKKQRELGLDTNNWTAQLAPETE